MVHENNKPFISIIVPAFNEEAIIEKNIEIISIYLNGLVNISSYEILIINDGSSDMTGEIANRLAERIDQIRVIHHPTNLNLGNALQTGFCNSKGDIIVVMDIDLSYSVEHIGRMVDKIIETSCDMVVASPYMKGGKVTDVPFLRKIMSLWLNRFMRFSAQQKVLYFYWHGKSLQSRFYSKCKPEIGRL